MAKNPKRLGGSPPKEHQFKKGQSGNPGGRPKKKPTLRDVFFERLERPIWVNLDGQRQQMTVLEALFDKHLAAADPHNFLRFLKWAGGEGPAPSELDDAEEDLELDDADVLKAAIDREVARRQAMEAGDE